MSWSAGPAPGAAGGSGRWSMAKVGHQQPRGVAGAGMPPPPLPHAARHGPAPASAVLGSPRGLWLLGVFPRGRMVLVRPRLLSPVHPPVPGRCSSRVASGEAARPGEVLSPVPVVAGARRPRRAARLPLLFLCPAAANGSSPVPPSCWLDGAVRCPRPVGGGGGAGRAAAGVPPGPQSRGFLSITLWCIFSATPAPAGAEAAGGTL